MSQPMDVDLPHPAPYQPHPVVETLESHLAPPGHDQPPPPPPPPPVDDTTAPAPPPASATPHPPAPPEVASAAHTPPPSTTTTEHLSVTEMVNDRAVSPALSALPAAVPQPEQQQQQPQPPAVYAPSPPPSAPLAAPSPPLAASYEQQQLPVDHHDYQQKLSLAPPPPPSHSPSPVPPPPPPTHQHQASASPAPAPPVDAASLAASSPVTAPPAAQQHVYIPQPQQPHAAATPSPLYPQPPPASLPAHAHHVEAASAEPSPPASSAPVTAPASFGAPKPIYTEGQATYAPPACSSEPSPAPSPAVQAANGVQGAHTNDQSIPTPPPSHYEAEVPGHQAYHHQPPPPAQVSAASAATPGVATTYHHAPPPMAPTYAPPPPSAPAPDHPVAHQQQQFQQLAPPPQQQPAYEPLPPPPAQLPPSHPLAPPPSTFSGAYQTPSDTTYDPPAAPPSPPSQQYMPPPAASAASLKRESPFDAGGGYGNGVYHASPGEQQPPAPKRSKTDKPAPLSSTQQKFFIQLVRSLKKNPSAYAFLVPVDPIALAIPQYPQIISHPMDLSTLEYKLQASGPKAKGRSDKGKYENREQVVADFRRIWNNSIQFNGPEHLVSLAGKELEKIFEKALPSLPKDEQPRRESVTHGGVPPARRNSGDDGRPKREIHPPPPKDLSWTAPSGDNGAGGPSGSGARRKSAGGGKRKSDEQMKYLKRELTEIATKKQYYEISYPFSVPVDPIALNIPDYFKIVKKPMDLSTIRSNLADGYYEDPADVNKDVQLMFKNCFLFNPPGTPVAVAGKALQAVWEEKWRNLPPKVYESESEEVDDDAGSDDDAINALQHQIAQLNRQLVDLKAKKAASKRAKSEKKAASSLAKAQKAAALASSSLHHVPPPAAAPVAVAPQKAPKPPKAASAAQKAAEGAYTPPAPAPPKPKKQNAASSSAGGAGPKKAKKQRTAADDDESDGEMTSVTMAQKQELADKIQVADGDVLHQAIVIIQQSMPLGDASDEIELDIESLPNATVLKLYELVVRGPKKAKQVKKSGNGGNKHATGGLNRKSMNEEVEAERIRKLEAKLAGFEQPVPPPAPIAAAAAPPRRPASESGSDSDDSASDSE